MLLYGLLCELLHKVDEQTCRFCLGTALACLFLFLSLIKTRITLRMLVCLQDETPPEVCKLGALETRTLSDELRDHLARH